MIDALAFADDLIIISSSRPGIKEALSLVGDMMSRMGLSLHPRKSKASVWPCPISVIPDGKNKKIKIMEESLLTLNAGPIQQLAAV